MFRLLRQGVPLVLTVLCVLSTSANAYAFGRRVCGVSCYHAAPVYYNPPQQVVSFYAPVQKIVTSTIAPLITSVPVNTAAYPEYASGGAYAYTPPAALTGYYSGMAAQGQQVYNASGVNVDAIRAVFREEFARICQQGGQPAPTPALPPNTGTAAPPAPAPSPAPAPDPPTTNNTTPLYMTEQGDSTPPDVAQAVLKAFMGKANCVSCHGGGGKLSGDFRLVWPGEAGGYRLANLPADKRWKVYGMASVGAMPPAAATDASKAMEADYLPALLKWAAQK